MDSIEIAKKLIRENDDEIETYRTLETEARKEMQSIESEMNKLESRLKQLNSLLSCQVERLEGLQSSKKELLVDNLALKLFIANGGGLDMV